MSHMGRSSLEGEESFFLSFFFFFLPVIQSFLENLHGQGSLEGYSPWNQKEPDTTEHSTRTILSMHLGAVTKQDPYHMPHARYFQCINKQLQYIPTVS